MGEVICVVEAEGCFEGEIFSVVETEDGCDAVSTLR